MAKSKMLININEPEMLEEASNLDLESSSEYSRGVCELIARCFPRAHTSTLGAAEEIKKQLSSLSASDE